ncbi:MAG: NAD-dependent malic enzyme [candidate division Zixibacteria bacterium]|jgi:malate dehydrogenase (oxaloacetate-decarboxylating)|nr:NAD-dependent malic enzyme [candidate division Zixibacteria bacterium]
MKRFEMRVDPLTHEIYYAVPHTGHLLVSDPLLNKGYAFTRTERAEFELLGLLSEQIGTLEQQRSRNYNIVRSRTNELEKYDELIALLDRNETVFYSLLTHHIEEMLPIVYTPTVGQACLKRSHIIRRWRGVYVSPSNVDSIEQILVNIGLPNISLLVATDGERILGLGDLGADGMGIPIGKIALYVAAAGIHPASTLPVMIDVGTNNERLLADPMYTGVRHPRLTGNEYYSVIERFVQGVRRVFPRALLQWEDFGKQHAATLLERYHDRILSFNDDIQGTGATAAAALRSAFRIAGRPLADERIAILGFGQAGSGVANALVTLMTLEGGLSTAEARRKIFAVDLNGLLLEGDKADHYQDRFLQPREAVAGWQVPAGRNPNLEEVIRHARITTLIGLSGQKGAFNEKILAALAANCERPIVLALSNPTSCTETTPEAVMAATGGRALMATGSPCAPVAAPDGRETAISQCNNLYVFPGMGLGAIVCQAQKITHRMFHSATCAISDMVSADLQSKGCLLPPLQNTREVSFAVALAVARQAREESVGIIASDDHLAELIRRAMWNPHYYPYRRERTS